MEPDNVQTYDSSSGARRRPATTHDVHSGAGHTGGSAAVRLALTIWRYVRIVAIVAVFVFGAVFTALLIYLTFILLILWPPRTP